jgi:hypothetical protein
MPIEDPVPSYPAVSVSRMEQDLNSEFETLSAGYFTRKTKRMEAWKQYNFQPYGNEKDGASKIVDSTIFNVVEWMTPSLIQPFFETSDFIKVVPESSSMEDIIAAEYNRELLNYQMRKRMDLYSMYYDTFKTFLVCGDAYLKLTWQNKDPKSGEPVGRPLMTPVTPDAMRYDWTVKGGFMNSKVVTHEEDWSRSDVIGMKGMKGVFDHRIDRVVAGGGRSLRTDRLRDEQVDDKAYIGEKMDISDKAKTLFLRREHWTEYDMKGDGILVPIMAVFIDDVLVQVMENPYDFKRPPFVMAECVRDPFGNPALGWADILSDIQKYRTALLRMTSDNMNSQTNGMFEVDQTSVDDIGLQLLMNAPQGSRIGIPTRKPGSITPIPSNPIAGHAFQVWELLEVAAENRGGFTRYSQGMDSKSLNQTATGFVGITQRSEMRLWEIATRFAESTLKPMIRMIISLNQQNLTAQDIEVQFGIDGRDMVMQDPETGEEIPMSAEPGDLIRVGKEDIGGAFSVTLDLQVGSDKQQNINNMFQYGQYLGSLQTVDPNVLNDVNQVILAETARLMNLPKVANVIRRNNAQSGRGIGLPFNSPVGPAPGAGGGIQGAQNESVISEAISGQLPGQPI